MALFGLCLVQKRPMLACMNLRRFVCPGVIAACVGAFLAPRPSHAQDAGGVALPLSRYSEATTFCVPKPPTNVVQRWQVSAEQAARIDSMLTQELSLKKYKRHLAGPVGAYARQHLGYYRGDRAVVFVNAVSPPPENWRAEVANACDGGAHFWGIEYDLSFERFENFSATKRPARGRAAKP